MRAQVSTTTSAAESDIGGVRDDSMAMPTTPTTTTAKTKMSYRTRLDEDGCIDLLRILQVVNQIDQEQAWAICYEVCTLMKSLASRQQHQQQQQQQQQQEDQQQQSQIQQATTTNQTTPTPITTSRCAPIESLRQVRLHKDGFVHEKTCLTTSSSSKHQQQQQPLREESELVASLGIALFWALDYGIPNDEERKLSIAMEYLIYQSQSAKLTFDEVLELCIKRLPPHYAASRTKADAHYKSVCKSLVQDTIQLSIFLEKIYTASMVLSDISEQDLMSELGEPLASLRALKIDDWARLWMHVIKELKQALAIT